MNHLSFIILSMTAGVLIIQGLRRSWGVLSYPFLVGAVITGWFLPQAYDLRVDMTLPSNGYWITMFYAAACLIAVKLGWDHALTVKSRFKIHQYSYNRLLYASFILSVVGIAAYSQIFNIDIQTTEEGFSTGLVTILFFFEKLQYFGLAIALCLLLQRYTLLALIIVLVDVNSIMGFVLWGGRRGPAITISLIILSLFWFQRRILLPRIAIIGGLLVGAIFISGISSYRQFVSINKRLPQLSEVYKMNIFEEGFIDNKNLEVTNAITYVSGALERQSYHFGADYWNYLVFSYIPGQLIGHNRKQALQFSVDDPAVAAYAFKRHPGTTYTGFADSFHGFSFFGVLIFYIFARILGRWWRRGMAGSLSDKVFYSIIISTGLLAITHGCGWFIAFALQPLIFLLPIFIIARIHPVREGTRTLRSKPRLNP